MYAPDGEARKPTSAATSSGEPKRPSGMRCCTASRCSVERSGSGESEEEEGRTHGETTMANDRRNAAAH